MLLALISNVFSKTSFRIKKIEKKHMLEDKSNSRLASKSFHEKDFFYLVDKISAELHEKHPQDAPLLDLNESEFPWELQVFANQFLRECVKSKGELTKFCSGLRKKLEDTEFRKKFWKILDAAYQQHFYVVDSEKHFLV